MDKFTEALTGINQTAHKAMNMCESLIAERDAARARVAELEGALTDAEFLLRNVGINWKESASMKDSCLRCSVDLREIIALKG